MAVDLRQQELSEWQDKNFGIANVERLALGMAEEVGELCHFVLKRSQGIREGVSGKEAKEGIIDSFGDSVIFGIQIMSAEGISAEEALKIVIDKVLKRDWIKYPSNGISN